MLGSLRALQLRLAGVPVSIEPTFLLILALLGYGGGRSVAQLVTWIVVAGLSVLVHELGHAVAFRTFGSQPRIVLHGLGGVTFGAPQPPARSVVVSLAGPFTGFAAGLLAIAVSRRVTTDSELVRTVFADLVFVNIAWGVFNLLPILPLDGGQAVTSLLNIVTHGRALRPARIISAVTAGALGLYMLSIGQTWIAFLSLFFVMQNVQALRAMRDRPRGSQLDQGRQALLRDDLDAAGTIAREVLAGRPSGRTEARARELAVWTALAADGPAAARARLGSAHGDALLEGTIEALAGRSASGLGEALARAEDPVTLAVAARLLADAGRLDAALTGLADAAAAPALETAQLVLHQAGRYAAAAAVGERLFARRPAPGVAYNVARSLAFENPDDALRWLDRAVANGFRDLGQLDTHPDLAPLRTTDRFRHLRASLQ